jgi:DnaJ-domain-containing protein 1
MQASQAREHLIRIPVRIELIDGRKLDLSIISPRALLKLYELINREEQFIDVEALDGERFILAKSAIKLVKLRETQQFKNLPQAEADSSTLDPHKILKVSKDQDRNTIHQAYLALVREYHPDKFASVSLPSEVNDYLTSMIRRINAAYDMLDRPA